MENLYKNLSKNEILRLKALNYAIGIKKVNEDVIRSWMRGFYYCDSTLGLSFQLKQYKEKLQDYIDNWKERYVNEYKTDEEITYLEKQLNKAKEGVSIIESLIEITKIFETKFKY
jgi:hypothetical protein